MSANQRVGFFSIIPPSPSQFFQAFSKGIRLPWKDLLFV